MSWDEAYAKVPAFFGAEPEGLVRDHVPVGGGLRILDLGVGQGRNTIPLARDGHSLTAIDPSRVAIDQVKDHASRERLDITTQVGDFQTWAAGDSFDVVLVIGLIPILAWDDIDALRLRLREWTIAGGRILVTAFTIEDPSFSRCRAHWREIGRNSYVDKAGSVRTFLQPDEMPQLFPQYDVIHHWEGLGPDHRHGEGPVHRHGLAELVAVKRD